MAEMAELAEVAEMFRNDDMFRMCLIHAHSKHGPLHTIPLNKTTVQCFKLTFNQRETFMYVHHTITQFLSSYVVYTYIKLFSFVG